MNPLPIMRTHHLAGRKVVLEQRVRPARGNAFSRKIHRWRRDHGLMWRALFVGSVASVECRPAGPLVLDMEAES